MKKFFGIWATVMGVIAGIVAGITGSVWIGSWCAAHWPVAFLAANPWIGFVCMFLLCMFLLTTGTIAFVIYVTD